MPRAIVLGSGMVGSVMAGDLARDGEYEVTLVDRSAEALERAMGRVKRMGGRKKDVKTVVADLSDAAGTSALVEGYDVALGAVSSVIGYSTLEAVIEAGTAYADISFMPQDFLELDGLAKKRGVTAVVDCGVAPGMSHVLAGYATTLLDETERIEIYVGGLPRERRWPFEYKAGFSPADVIEEYTRPARLVERGEVVIREALSEPELIDLPGVGTLEAFNTDGLRSLVGTLDVPWMKEKTLRYPGHIELMRVFRETGLFSQAPIEAGGVVVRPLDVTSALMFPKWSYEEGEADLTVMRVMAEGVAGGVRTRLTWDMLDFLDAKTGATSMSRTTAFPCVIVGKMLAEGKWKKKGVHPPEVLGREKGVAEKVLRAHEERGVVYEVVVEEVEGEATERRSDGATKGRKR
ncbi:MAG: saccharopine dehydrogenase C-terminal domain-containing protein [Planctomycetota bacterium]|nr:saccharopine dehydrogenase C-terminal domain-containing protein [Planctomycetota bacterium]